MLEEGLYSYLANDATVTAIVSGRIYPLLLPQDPTYPAITYSRESSYRDITFTTGQNGFLQTDIQVDCWGSTYSSAKNLSETIRQELKNYSGTLGGHAVNACYLTADVEIFEQAVEAYRVSLNFTFYHHEA